MTLHSRVLQPEIMDQPGLDIQSHEHALQGLARINWWSNSVAILWPAIRKLAQNSERPLRVLDMATGAGDVPVRLSRKATKAGIRLEISGCDRSETAIRFAQKSCRDHTNVRFFQHDVLRETLDEQYDVITCSLFLHHLDEEEALTLLRNTKEAARRLVLINDLRRCRLGWLAAWLGTQLLTRSPVVHYDGPVSVGAAFTTAEIQALAGHAGLEGAVLSRKWPFRYLLQWSK